MVKNGSDRSVSPTSPLDCIDITEDFYVGDAASDDEDHESGSQFLEDLPTPRGCSVLESAINNDDIPDMNNALSDSDDYDLSRHSAIHSLSTYTVCPFLCTHVLLTMCREMTTRCPDH